MNEARDVLSSAAAGDGPAWPSVGSGNVETLAAGVAVPGAIGGDNGSADGPRDLVAMTLLIILFLAIATLGHMAFAVQRWPKRWIPVRVRSRYRAGHDPRWR